MLMARYTPGSSVQAAMSAMMATSDSNNIAPYPMGRAYDSRVMIFGVMPLAMRVWKPLMAPQAMVMKQKGNSLPGTTGPEPSMKAVRAGILRVGSTNSTPAASATMVPSFMKVLR